MSYFTATTRGLDIGTGLPRQAKRLFRDADTAWIELTNFWYELSIFGELHSTSFSLEEATAELETALIHRYGRGTPDALEIMEIGDGVRGVDMADLARRS